MQAKARWVLERAELERTLQSLALGRKHVLKKSTKEKEILETDTFCFNADFTDQRYQVHINSIQAKETVGACDLSRPLQFATTDY